MSDLDRASEALSAVRKSVFDVLLDCGAYVERRAAAGDPEAVRLAGLLADAFATMTCVGIDAATTIEEHRS
jgi:hypothetical protein